MKIPTMYIPITQAIVYSLIFAQLFASLPEMVYPNAFRINESSTLANRNFPTGLIQTNTSYFGYSLSSLPRRNKIRSPRAFPPYREHAALELYRPYRQTSWGLKIVSRRLKDSCLPVFVQNHIRYLS